MESIDQANENCNDVSSIKIELDETNEDLEKEQNNEQITFSDANESISDIENSNDIVIEITDTKDSLKSISNIIVETPKLVESITDESNTEDIKEEINTIKNQTTMDEVNTITDEVNTITNEINTITETNLNIPNITHFTLDNELVVSSNLSIDHHVHNVLNTNHDIIPLADIIASDVNNTNKKHVTISDILLQPIVSNPDPIKIDTSLILNNGEDIEQVSNTNTPSEISYINKIKKYNFNPNKTFKHIQQIKPNKKHKNFELDQIDTVYNKLQDYIRNVNIDRTNYILLVAKCVEIIDNSNNVADSDRKLLAIKSLNRIITVDLNLSSFDNNYIIENIDNSIELIITASKYKSKNSQLQKNIADNDNIVYATAGQIIPSILDKIITIILKRRYTVEKIFTNLGTLVYILILFTEQYPYLNGVEKKNILFQTMEQLIHVRIEYILKITPEKKQELIQGLDSISYIIDTLIALQKGKYKINKKHIMPNKKSFMNLLCCRSQNID